MSKEMTGAEMVIEALADQGVEHLFGYPAARCADLRRPLPAEEGPAHPRAARAGRRARGRRLCALDRQGRLRAGHLRPGATNAVTGITDALCDSIPIVVITGQSADPSDRQRRLPGVRHRRHHAALYQAQLPGEERRRPAARPARGVSHREERAAGAGGRGHPQGHPVRRAPIRGRRNSSTRATIPRSRATSTASRRRSS